MAVANPVTSSQPEAQTPSSRPMSSVDIGLIVGSIILFLVVITSVFIARGLDGRRRAKGALRRAEEGRTENRNEHNAVHEISITEVTPPGPAQLRHKSFWGRNMQALKDRIERLKRRQDSSNDTETGQAKEDVSIGPENPQPSSKDAN